MQIDSYGFPYTSSWFKRKELEPYQIKVVGTVTYFNFSAAPKGPIHRLERFSDGSYRQTWAYGAWENAASLTYVPINETLEIEEEVE